MGAGFGTGLAPLALYLCAVGALLLSIFWRPQVGLYFLIPMLPLQTTRYKLLQYPLGGKLVFIILLGVILGLLLRGELRLPRALPLKKLLLGFVLFQLASLLYGYSSSGVPAFSLNDPRFEGWVNYMIMPALYALVACAIKNIQQMKILILLMCLALPVVTRGFMRSVRGRDLSHFSYAVRDAGPLGFAGENGLAAFEAEVSVFLLGLAAFEKRKTLQLAILAILAANMYCLLFSFSRGGYAAFLVGVVVLGLLKQRKLLIPLFALGIGWQAVMPTAVMERITMTFDVSGSLDNSAATRISLWQDASQLFMARPIFGSGFATYQFMRRVDFYTDTHNFYLKVLVESGLLGLILFLCVLGGMALVGYRLFRTSPDPFLRSVGLGFAAMLSTAAVANLVGDRWSFLQVSGYLWVLLGCAARGQMIVRESNEEETGYGDEESLIAELPKAPALMAQA